MRKANCALLLLSIFAFGLNGSEVYKWVDEQGQVHYSQSAPANVPAEQMPEAPPPANDPAAIRGDLQRQLEAFDERRAERDEAFAEQKQKEDVARIRQQNCETARKNLEKLRRGGNNAYMTPEGEVIRLSDEDRAARIEAAKQGIAENCDN